MRSPSETRSPTRVLLRVPDLSTSPAPAKAKQPEVETFVQEPLAPLAPLESATTAPVDPPKAKPKVKPAVVESSGVTPDELKAPSVFARPLTVLIVLAVAAGVGIALSDHRKQDDGQPPDTQLAGPADQPVPGGIPTEITQIPEITFPDASTPPAPAIPPAPTPPPEQVAPAAPAVPDTMRIERLPTTTPGTTPEGATAKVSDTAPAQAAQQPIVAQLESRIEQPKSR